MISSVELALDEIRGALRQVDAEKFEEVAQTIYTASVVQRRPIVGLGAGRMGYSLRAFIMRLSHIGASAFMIGDTSVPRVNKDSLVLVNSSSGETPSVLLFARQAKEAGSHIILFTQSSSRLSSIASISDLVLTYGKVESQQLMKTVPEQSSWILFDALASHIVKTYGLDVRTIEQNHSILE